MNRTTINNLLHHFERNRGRYYTTKMFDLAMKGKITLLFPDEVIGLHAVKDYYRNYRRDVKTNPKEDLSAKGIKVMSSQNQRDLEYLDTLRQPTFLDNSTIIRILRYSESLSCENSRLQEEIDFLKPYRAFTDPQSYFNKKIAELESKNRILVMVAERLGVHVRGLKLTLEFKLPLAAFLFFYSIIFSYIVYALIKL